MIHIFITIRVVRSLMLVTRFEQYLHSTTCIIWGNNVLEEYTEFGESSFCVLASRLLAIHLPGPKRVKLIHFGIKGPRGHQYIGWENHTSGLVVRDRYRQLKKYPHGIDLLRHQLPNKQHCPTPINDRRQTHWFIGSWTFHLKRRGWGISVIDCLFGFQWLDRYHTQYSGLLFGQNLSLHILTFGETLVFHLLTNYSRQGTLCVIHSVRYKINVCWRPVPLRTKIGTNYAWLYLL